MDEMTYNKYHFKYIEDIKYIAESIQNDVFIRKNILITGATGLIGTCLIDAFMYANKYFGTKTNVLALGRSTEKAIERFSSYWNHPQFHFIQHDIANPVRIEKCDIIIHAASNAHPKAYVENPVETIMTNIEGTKNVLDLARLTKAKVVFLSTVEVYGQSLSNDFVFNEEYNGAIDLNVVRNGYPESKRLGEILCHCYYSKYEVEIKIARLCRVFGPTMLDSDSKATAQFIRNAKRHKPIILKSNGEQKYSFCYAADACSAILHILVHGKTCFPYNVSNSKCNCKLKEFAMIAGNYSGQHVQFELLKQVNDGSSNAKSGLLDSRRLNSLGWFGKYSLEDAIIRSIEILFC